MPPIPSHTAVLDAMALTATACDNPFSPAGPSLHSLHNNTGQADTGQVITKHYPLPDEVWMPDPLKALGYIASLFESPFAPFVLGGLIPCDQFGIAFAFPARTLTTDGVGQADLHLAAVDYEGGQYMVTSLRSHQPERTYHPPTGKQISGYVLDVLARLAAANRRLHLDACSSCSGSPDCSG